MADSNKRPCITDEEVQLDLALAISLAASEQEADEIRTAFERSLEDDAGSQTRHPRQRREADENTPAHARRMEADEEVTDLTNSWDCMRCTFENQGSFACHRPHSSTVHRPAQAHTPARRRVARPFDLLWSLAMKFGRP